jgi:hypothetical protein
MPDSLLEQLDILEYAYKTALDEKEALSGGLPDELQAAIDPTRKP